MWWLSGPGWCEWPTLQSEPTVISRSMLLLRAMSGTGVLLQPRSVSISVAHFSTEGYMDIHGLGCCLKPYWCPRAMLPPGSWVATWGHGDVQIHVAPEGHVWFQGPTSSGFCINGQCLRFVVLLKSMLLSVVWAATWIHVDVCRPFCPQGPYWCEYPVLPPRSRLVSVVWAASEGLVGQ